MEDRRGVIPGVPCQTMTTKPDHHNVKGQRRVHRRMEGFLRGTATRLADFERGLRELRERTQASEDRLHLGVSLDVALHELGYARRAVASLADEFGEPAAGVQAPTPSSAPAGAPRAPSVLAARLMADCEACGKKACAMLRMARAIKNAATERMACVLLRTFEKLLWLLRIHAEVDARHALTNFSGQIQLRALAI
jgi:hypothetical protein